MKAHKALHQLADVVKTYQPRQWTFDSCRYAYFNADTIREFHDLSDAFDALTGVRPLKGDTPHQCVNQWDWHGWRISLSVFVDAPTGYEATA